MIGGRFKVASVASVAAAGLFMGGVAAQSADLGGNCCADLEERVAELEATTARKGNRKQSLTIYGQVAYGMVAHNDESLAADNEVTIRNMNGRSGTRFGFKGQAKINADVSMGFRIEIGVDDTSPLLGASGTRYSNLYVKSKSMGTLTLGQGSEVTDNINNIKLGGAFGGLMSADESPDASPTAAAASSNAFDGGRSTGVTYQTPTLGGFTVSAGWYNGDPNVLNARNAADVALRYAGEFGAIRVAAGVGYKVTDNLAAGVSDTKTVSGSASIMHVPTGIFLNGAYGETHNDNKARHGAAIGADLSGWGVSTGIAQKWNSLGKTSIELRYAQLDSSVTGINPTSYGVGLSQNIDAAAAEFYALYEHYDTDQNIVADDVDVVTVGMRVTF